jgi:hypothetical protein
MKLSNCSVGCFLSLLSDYSRIFLLPLSMVASHQLAEPMDSLEEWNREPNSKDKWVYIWGAGIFTSKQAYDNMKGHLQAPSPFQWLWKSQCQGKHKVFFLLLLNDRLNTRKLLRRKRFNAPSADYIMCSHGIEETLKHLFFDCEFAQICWTSLHIVWDLSLPVTEMIEDGKQQFQFSCFMEVIILASWSIWIPRNNFIFNDVQISFHRWKKEFRELFLLCKHRAKPSLDADMNV